MKDQKQDSTLRALSTFKGGCKKCPKKKETLQRAAVNSGPDVVPSIVNDVLRSPGQPLDREVRTFMDTRFNYDFSKVRVHTDTKSAESTRALDALAYTVGNDVIFGTGQYSPETNDGKRLLAHELVHVVQQRGIGALSKSSAINELEDEAESEAEHTASQVLSLDGSFSINRLNYSSRLLQRQSKKGPAPKSKKTPGNTIIKKPTRSSYAVKAETLDEAAKIIDALTEAGKTEWNPKYKVSIDDKGVVTSAEVTVPLKITMPNWPKSSKLSKAAKAEWDRFYRALEEHEQGHVNLVRERMSGLGESMIGKTEPEAKEIFDNALAQLQGSSDNYDVETDHGRNQGTIIDTSIK